MYNYFTITNILLIISLVSLIWILGVIIFFTYSKKKALKNFSGTINGRECIIEDFKTKSKSKLLDLNPTDAILIWANITLSLFAVFTYIDSRNQNELLHRAYIGINSEISILADNQVGKDGKINSGGIKFQLKVKNYGDLPTTFSAYLKGWPENRVKAFQNVENYIMPDQEFELAWNLDYSNLDSVSVCNLFDEISIDIFYLKHSLKVLPKVIEDPRYNQSGNKKFDVVMYDCTSGSGVPSVLVWYAQEIK